MKNHIKVRVPEQSGVAGVITTRLMRPPKDNPVYLKLIEGKSLLDDLVEQGKRSAAHKLRLQLGGLMEDLHQMAEDSGWLHEKVVQHNLVVTTGLEAITKALTTNLTTIDEVEINVAAVGSNTATPAAGDTTLGSEAFRQTITSLNYASGVAYATMLIDYADANATHYETGLFLDADDGVTDDGTLFNRALLNSPTGVTKTSGEVLTISFQITFTAS